MWFSKNKTIDQQVINKKSNNNPLSQQSIKKCDIEATLSLKSNTYSHHQYKKKEYLNMYANPNKKR